MGDNTCLLIESCIKQGWSYRRLQDEVQREFPRKLPKKQVSKNSKISAKELTQFISRTKVTTSIKVTTIYERDW